jgi:adenylosuccinate synthase
LLTTYYSGPFPTEQINEHGEKLQQIGREVGVTTGRKRRCGWLDLVVVKYSHEVNGYTALNLTKLDILDDFDEILVATSYVNPSTGEALESFPANGKLLEKVEVKYETLPGWKTNTYGTKTWFDLPKKARDYVEFIEAKVGVKVKYIGTGPGREHMIYRDALPV